MLSRCHFCGSVVISGAKFCGAGCEMLYNEDQLAKSCQKCDRELLPHEERICDNCRYRR